MERSKDKVAMRLEGTWETRDRSVIVTFDFVEGHRGTIYHMRRGRAVPQQMCVDEAGEDDAVIEVGPDAQDADHYVIQFHNDRDAISVDGPDGGMVSAELRRHGAWGPLRGPDQGRVKEPPVYAPQAPPQDYYAQPQHQQPSYGNCPKGGNHVPGKTDANGKLHCAKCGRYM